MNAALVARLHDGSAKANYSKSTGRPHTQTAAGVRSVGQQNSRRFAKNTLLTAAIVVATAAAATIVFVRPEVSF
jgi:hypothetical protein